ncbi:hypothetical protein ACIO14_00270 [Nocardia fluminea]|uniref:hypothetical protein n=1 Tax=Nocardia fluminea TaxID=134984 RepID=UPI0038145C97
MTARQGDAPREPAEIGRQDRRRIRRGPIPAFDIDADYRRFVDGRSRSDGVRSFLRSRGMTVPEGSAQDPPSSLTVAGLAARKQDLFAAEIAASGVRVFPDAAALLRRLRAARRLEPHL